jgi:hypothetical protein
MQVIYSYICVLKDRELDVLLHLINVVKFMLLT